MHFDEIDKKLIGLLQREFPMTQQPFEALGLMLGIESSQVIKRIERFKEEGIVGQIGPVLEARKLGCYTTLVAFKVSEENLEMAAEAIRTHPGVSHGYTRDHELNVWITLSTSSAATMRGELRRLKEEMGAEKVAELPVVTLYKIGFYLNLDDSGQPLPNISKMSYRKASLSPSQRAVLNELQQDLPLVDRPFDIMSNKLSISTAGFLYHCRSLIKRGIVRRFGAAINHRRAGYKANAMTCWAVPPDKIDTAGARLAACREVSHCYRRKTGRNWRYNLFAMIHGKEQQECFKVADAVTEELGLEKYMALFSTKELKKERVRHSL